MRGFPMAILPPLLVMSSPNGDIGHVCGTITISPLTTHHGGWRKVRNQMEKQRPSRQTRSTIATITCPLLIHGDGVVAWANQAFAEQFGIRPLAVKNLKVRELLWCLGIQDPLAGMISEGVTFDHWEAPPLSPMVSVLYLRQVLLSDEYDQSQRFILIISDTPELPNVMSSLDEKEFS
jgi:hypothetical protein